jgi:ketosteroid isomerase-like protein
MLSSRTRLVVRVTSYLLAGLSVISFQGGIEARASDDEQTLWNVEHSYWRYVQDNDLKSYLGLWDENFLGWPSVSATPVHKDHITDWITSQTSKGLAFKTGQFKPAAIQVSGDFAVTCYWITFKWTEKNGDGATHTLRVTHTWRKDSKGWRIIGGMSMAEATP